MPPLASLSSHSSLIPIINSPPKSVSTSTNITISGSSSSSSIATANVLTDASPSTIVSSSPSSSSSSSASSPSIPICQRDSSMMIAACSPHSASVSSPLRRSASDIKIREQKLVSPTAVLGLLMMRETAKVETATANPITAINHTQNECDQNSRISSNSSSDVTNSTVSNQNSTTSSEPVSQSRPHTNLVRTWTSTGLVSSSSEFLPTPSSTTTTAKHGTPSKFQPGLKCDKFCFCSNFNCCDDISSCSVSFSLSHSIDFER